MWVKLKSAIFDQCTPITISQKLDNNGTLQYLLTRQCRLGIALILLHILECSTQKLPFGGVNTHFKHTAHMLHNIKPCILSKVHRIPRDLDSDKRQEILHGWSKLAYEESKMADGCHLKKKQEALTQRDRTTRYVNKFAQCFMRYGS